MVSSVGFFTPLRWSEDNPHEKTFGRSVLQASDALFGLFSDKIAFVDDAILDPFTDDVLVEIVDIVDATSVDEGSCNWLFTTLKIAALFTLILPLLALIAKAVLRPLYSFKEKILFNDPRFELQRDLTLLFRLNPNEKAQVRYPDGEIVSITMRQAVESVISLLQSVFRDGERIPTSVSFSPHSRPGNDSKYVEVMKHLDNMFSVDLSEYEKTFLTFNLDDLQPTDPVNWIDLILSLLEREKQISHFQYNGGSYRVYFRRDYEPKVDTAPSHVDAQGDLAVAET